MNLNPRTEGKEFPVWILHGPSGSGKTRAAATASEFHSLRPLEQRKSMIDLTDLLWLSFDKDGIQSLQSQGMEPLYYDFSHMVPELAKWQAHVYSKLEEARQKVVEHRVKFVVVDTLSAICDYFDSYHLGTGTHKDPRLAYGASLQAFKTLMLKLRALPCAQLWLCHSKTIWVDDEKVTEQQEATRTADLPGEYDIDLALTRGWQRCVRPCSNLTMGLSVDDNGQRWLVTESKSTPRWYVKNRYDDFLKARETVDIRGLFARITQFESYMKASA